MSQNEITQNFQSRSVMRGFFIFVNYCKLITCKDLSWSSPNEFMMNSNGRETNGINCTVPPLYIHVTTKNKITNERTNRCWMISNYKSEKIKTKKLKDKFKKEKILGILARISLLLENISTDYKPSSIYSPIEYRLNKRTNIYLKGYSCSWCKKKK